MSFGFSIGDFLAVSTLAWKCYKSCRESSDEFMALSTEVVSLHAVLKEAEDHIAERKVGTTQEARLFQIGQGCQEVLKDLDALVLKYESLATKSQRTWDRMRWGHEDVEKLRSRLVSNVILLTAFNTSVSASCQALVAKKLNKLLAEMRSGERDGSVMSIESVESIGNDDQTAWMALYRELEDVGISAELANQHKSYIISWMKAAIENQLTIENPTGDVNLSRTTQESIDQRSGITEMDPSRLLAGYEAPSVAVFDNGGPPLSKKSLGTRVMTTLLKPFRSPTAIHKAARDGDLKKIKQILSLGSNINFQDGYQLSALHWAIMRGHFAASALLLEQGADPEQKDSDGRTALGVAAWQGIEDIVDLLLDHGANVFASDSQGLSPLHGTARNRCPKVCSILLSRGADVNIRDSQGWTALHWAARQGYDELVDILFSAGSDLAAESCDAETPLALATRHGHKTTKDKIQALRQQVV